MDEVDKHAKESVNKILVGNKCDLVEERKVTFEEGKVFFYLFSELGR